MRFEGPFLSVRPGGLKSHSLRLIVLLFLAFEKS
jgi:hypothetical protein